MRLALVISSLQQGGAERALSLLANSWAESGKDVTIFRFDHGEAPAYAIHPSVKLRSLYLLGISNSWLSAVSRNLSRIRTLRRAIRETKPDVVISFMDRVNVLTLLATRGLGTPVIASEQTDPSGYDIGVPWKMLRSLVYGFAEVLVCPTSSVLSQFNTRLKVNGCRIPNIFPAPPTAARRESQASSISGTYVLVALGRLVHEKGFDILLNAFSQIADRHPNWTLKIIGGGHLRSDLEGLAANLNLTGRVHFAGSIADPFPVLCRCDLFVLSSRVEGFPLALCEAMACGLPAVSFDCPSGPRDIIRQGIDGILVPPADVTGLAKALDRLMADPQERLRLAARAPEVLTRFSQDHILSLWEDILNKSCHS